MTGTAVSKELFGQIDANKDGKVNAEELARHFRRAYEAAVEGKAARILSLADANNVSDGKESVLAPQ